MADPLAQQLNNAYTGAVSPAPVGAPAPQASWSDRFKSYLKDTDMGALSEAFMRINPTTIPLMWYKDYQQGGIDKVIENQRTLSGQQSRIISDIPASVVGFYPGVSSILEQTGAINAPLPGAETLGNAADAIDAFGRKTWAEPIAGKSLEGDLHNSLLRGSSADMAGNWSRLMGQAIVPLPTKVTAPIIAGANMMKTGIKAVDVAGELALKTAEAITPLAISSRPSAKVMAANIAAQGVIGPLAESAIMALKPEQEATKALDQADQIAKDGTAQATAGQDAILNTTAPAVTPKFAGIPSTGDTATDIAITGAVGIAGLFAFRNRDMARRLKDGTTRALTGYDPKLTEDASIQPLGVKIQQQLQSGDASLHHTIKETMKAQGGFTDQQIADEVLRRKEEAASRKGAGISTRQQQWMFDGSYMGTPIRSVPGNDLAIMHNKLSESQQKIAAAAEWSEQELNVRQRAMRKDFHGTGHPLETTPIGTWHARGLMETAPTPAGPWGPVSATNRYASNLYEHTNKQLLAKIAEANRDPDVVAFRRAYRDVINKAGDYMGQEKRFNPADVAKFKVNNPHYVPPRISDKESYLHPRDPVDNLNTRTGEMVARGVRTFEELGNPMETLPRYMDEVFRSTEGMKIKRDFMSDMLRAARNGNPFAKQIIGRDLSGAPAGEAAHNFVTWRDADGNKRTTEIKDAVVRDALRGVSSPTMLQLQHGTISKLTRYYESGAVGPLSLISGTVFAPKSAMYAATIGTLLPRPKGVAIGWIDRLTQSTLGFSTPGVDALTTMPIDMAIRAGGNIGTVVVERLARVMHNSVLKDGILTKAVDPATLERMAGAMHDWYKKTAMYDMQSQGLMSPGSFMAVDPTRMYNNPSEALKGAKGLFGGGGHFIGDILHAISAAPNMSIRAMNKPFGVDDWRTASAIRNLSGDPGSSGAFRNAPVLAGAVNVTPWGNIYVQSMSKLVGSFNSWDKAAYSTVGIINGITIPAIMATMWNDNQGPEYAQYQFFGRTPDKQASSIYIAIPGRLPNEGLEIDIDPLARFAKYIGEGLAGLHMGAFTGDMHKPENADQKRMFGEMMTHRMASIGEGSVLRSLFQQSVLPPLPGVVQGGLALAGVQARSYVDARVPDAKRRELGGGFAAPAGHSFLDDVVPGLGEDVVRGIGSSAAGAVWDFIAGIQRDTDPKAAAVGNVTKTLPEALGTQFKEFKQRVSDSTSQVSGPLFNTFRAIVPSQDASSQLVKQKLDNIKDINAQFQATHKSGAPREMIGTKKTGFQERLGTNPAQPDQDVGAIAQSVSDLYKQLQPTLSEIKMHYTQHQSLQGSNLFTPNMKRALREDVAENIVDTNRRMLLDIQRAEQVLSETYGRDIKFGKLNLRDIMP